MSKSLPSMLLPLAMLALPSCTQPPDPKTEHAQTATYSPGVPGGIAVETTTITANIAFVYKAPREVVIDLPGGKRETVKCGPEIVNFDQLKSGDLVKITLTQEVAVAMGTESDPPDTKGDSVVALAPKGSKPGALMANIKQVTATVVSIDPINHTATLMFPDGRSHEVAVRSDVDLSQRKVGEKVVIRKTDVMALKVETPEDK